jgi:hypothetical protein
MAIFGHPKDAASNPDSWDWRHDGMGADAIKSPPLPPNWPTGLTAVPGPTTRQEPRSPADSDWETALDSAAKTTNRSPGAAPAAGRTWRLPEPATIAIWSSLGLLLGLRVWQHRRSEAIWGGGDTVPSLASNRRPWSSQQRLAIRQTIQRGCRQEFETGGL